MRRRTGITVRHPRRSPWFAAPRIPHPHLGPCAHRGGLRIGPEGRMNRFAYSTVLRFHATRASIEGYVAERRLVSFRPLPMVHKRVSQSKDDPANGGLTTGVTA